MVVGQLLNHKENFLKKENNMKVQFKDTFFESVEKLVWYDTKLWRVWEVIRYGIPRFVGNIWKFRKELYSHRWYDYRYSLELLHRSLTIMEAKLSVDGFEVSESRDKKTAKMRRAIQLLDNRLNDNYIDQAEKELGELIMKSFEFEPTDDGLYTLKDNETKKEKQHNSKVFKLAQNIDEKEWKELWKIFEGQNINEYKKLSKSLTPEEHKRRNIWNEWFDGTDMRGWWD
jgi:hypothetical protein